MKKHFLVFPRVSRRFPRWSLLGSMAIFLLLGLGIVSETASAAKRIDYVVGIDTYPQLDEIDANKKLDNPVHDAKAIVRKLGKLGYEVTSGINPTRREF